MNLKQEIARKIGVKEELILNSPKKEMGDFCFPCFSLAKEKKLSPMIIASEIQKSLEEDALIEKTEVVGGYLNFFLNKQIVGESIFKEIKKLSLPQIGKGKVICIDYCSVNLAKYMHIGHFSTTIIGESVARIYECLGYKVIRINYVGDYGTPFGKMVVAYKLWGDKKELEEKGIDAVQDLYVKFCANENEELLEKARFASKQIEDKIGDDYEIYKWIIDITIEETRRLVGRMNISFDDWRGESTYNNKMHKPLAEISDAGLSKIENGATIYDMNEFGLGVCVLKRSDGATLYITRDLAAVEDRYNLYNFDEMLYVTASQQNSHFAKLFKICEVLKKPYANKLKHVNYGMFSLPEGKIASRKGKQALFGDILDEAEENARNAVKDRNLNEEQKEIIAKNVAMAAISFSILKVERIKDQVFDLEKAISFDGETGPYLQYTYARMNSLIKNYEAKYKAKENILPEITDAVFDILKTLNNYENTILEAKENCEPSIISKMLITLCQNFNKYYNENKIITDNELESAGKINLVKLMKEKLGKAMNLVCITPVNEM